ncbi:MAG: YbgC/FadM family acyl-CoA thioesterase [Sutterellaceae bacterium]|nr:YbgC/FadM family acyl-CoA thioesterase [Sutterellaceae bacterium]MDD7442842.1 YbgC/FadM family acyl-CoA thioesterase [Sutterellaceae bacterium]MDY2868680.1 YbgC/FadM family acyl-CoA thioesterase [Mesosutterella sp.]
MRKPHEYPVTVQWEDTDAGGVVYHANYLKFMERARSASLREFGVSQRELENETGVIMVVADLSIRYRHPALLEDRLTVKTIVKELRHASCLVSQSVWRGEDLLTEGSVRLVCVKRNPLRPAPFPPVLTRFFSSWLEEDGEEGGDTPKPRA